MSGRKDREAHLALSTGSPRHMGLGYRCAADPDRYYGQWKEDQSSRADHEAGLHVCLRSRYRKTGLADRRTAGTSVRCTGRKDVANPALPNEAEAVRASRHELRRPDRFHTGTEG